MPTIALPKLYIINLRHYYVDFLRLINALYKYYQDWKTVVQVIDLQRLGRPFAKTYTRINRGAFNILMLLQVILFDIESLSYGVLLIGRFLTPLISSVAPAPCPFLSFLYPPFVTSKSSSVLSFLFFYSRPSADGERPEDDVIKCVVMSGAK